MKYGSYSVRLLKRAQGSIWQARLKYKDPITNKWKETSKMLPEAKGKREANKMALEWFNSMNEAASLAPERKNKWNDFYPVHIASLIAIRGCLLQFYWLTTGL